MRKNNPGSGGEELALLARATRADPLIKPYRDILRESLHFVGPTFLARLFELGMVFSGSVFLGRTSLEYLAASGLITTALNIIVVPTRVSLYAIGMLGVRAYGKSDEVRSLQRLSEIYYWGLVHAAILSAFNYLLLFHIKPILTLFRQGEQESLYVDEFFKGYLLGLPAYLLQVDNQQILLSVFKPWKVATINFLQACLFVPLAYLSVVSHPDFLPESRSRSLGYAYALTYWLTFLVSSVYICLTDEMSFLRNHFTLALRDTTILRELMKNGAWIGIQSSSETVSFTVMMGLAGVMGTEALAAAEASTQYLWTLGIPTAIITQAAMMLIGKEVGETERCDFLVHFNARRISVVTLGLTCIIPLLFSASVAAAGTYFAKLFLKEGHEDSVDLVVKLLWINAGIQLCNAPRFNGMASLRAYKDNQFMGVYSYVQCALVSVLSWFIGYHKNAGLPPMFLVSLTFIAISAFVAQGRWLQMNGSKILSRLPSNNAVTQELVGGEEAKLSQALAKYENKIPLCSRFFPKVDAVVERPLRFHPADEETSTGPRTPGGGGAVG